MSIKKRLLKLENDQPFVKIGIEGFAGDGKTFTAVEIALGLHKQLEIKAPILAYITEPGLKRLRWKFDEAGVEVLIMESRSLIDLVETIEYAEELGTVLLIDSITHVWKGFTESYLQQRNEARRNKGWKESPRLSFEDWAIIKPDWSKGFNDKFVESKAHIIMCGRASYDYDYELNEDTRRKELVKSGVKMVTEKNTAYEPDINLFMSTVEVFEAGNIEEVYRLCKVKKDRTTKIDGMLFKNPTYEHFKPAMDALLNGISRKAQRVKKDRFNIAEGDGSKKIELEKIKGQFDRMKFGTSKEDKAAKAEVTMAIFGTLSSEEIGQKKTRELQECREILESFADWYIESCNQAQADGIDPPGIEEMKTELVKMSKPKN